MKERSIIMPSSMVLAILRGDKSQFRKAINFSKVFDEAPFCLSSTFDDKILFGDSQNIMECFGKYELQVPFKVGDLFWVKESFSANNLEITYQADTSYDPNQVWISANKMKSSQSRIFLEITDIKVERLQDISESDAKSEGVDRSYTWEPDDHSPSDEESGYFPPKSFYEGFQQFWSSRYQYGFKAWKNNPWVFVIEFKRI